jgi:uncharacterized protein (TIGR03437 family)
VYLSLNGTGIRRQAGAVMVTIAGIEVGRLYAGFQPQYPGLDPVNVLLPESLRGAGVGPISISQAGFRSNVVTITVQ